MLLRVNNVYFSYKKRGPIVLDNINIDIYEKGIDVFLGHNGAGKSTLFMLISGHLKVKKGEIVFNSKYINNRNQIAFVPEIGGYFESFTPSENLRFRYLLSEQPEEGLNRQIDQMLKMFGLDIHDDKICKQLSCGLKKRLAIACALISNPQLLLLDEPTNGIDPVTRELLIKILYRLDKGGTKILISTHDLNFVSEIANRITILNQGKIVAEKTDCNNIDKNDLMKLYFETTMSKEVCDYEYF